MTSGTVGRSLAHLLDTQDNILVVSVSFYLVMSCILTVTLCRRRCTALLYDETTASAVSRILICSTARCTGHKNLSTEISHSKNLHRKGQARKYHTYRPVWGLCPDCVHVVILKAQRSYVSHRRCVATVH